MSRDKVINIGVISDTHGLLRPAAVEALRGSLAIIHAGDVGNPEILAELEEIAPVTTVRGNVDTAAWATALPKTNVLEIGGFSLYVLHNLNDLHLDPVAGGFQAVIFGHSHQPLLERRKNVLFFNPGSAGPRRFSLPISVGRLILDQGELRAELIRLD